MKVLLMVLLAVMNGKASDFPRVDQAIKEYDQKLMELKKEFNQPTDPGNKEWVKTYLAHLVKVDQFMRLYWMNTPKKYSEEEKKEFNKQFIKRLFSLDAENTKELKSLLKKYRWFTISEFGTKADGDAWLLVQHADQDPQFQKEVLVILTELYPKNETNRSNYAYLFDRVATAYNDPSKRELQRYGTQGRCVSEGKWEPWPIENAAAVDQRRKEMGLGTMADYIAGFKEICSSADHLNKNN